MHHNALCGGPQLPPGRVVVLGCNADVVDGHGYPIAGTDRTGTFDEAVLACVSAIPAGRVMSYGDVAEYVGSRAPRSVGRVLAMEGSDVPWHRVIGASGRCAHHLEAEQLERLRAEGVSVTDGRVDMARYRWDGSVVG
jgi:methylated-DNA-protein-cysteine methyltransferase related protein